MSRRLMTAVTALALIAGLQLACSHPAAAGVPQKVVTVSDPYATNWVFRSTALKACAFIEVTGTMQGTHRYVYLSSGGTYNPNTYEWYDIKLVNPKITTKTGSISGAGCDFTKPVSLSKLAMDQQWYEGSCTLDPGISPGFPWSISFQPTYSCSKTDVARHSTSYGAGTSFQQVNSGAPAYYKGSMLAPSTTALPFRVNIVITAYRLVSGTQTSDSFAAGNGAAYLKG